MRVRALLVGLALALSAAAPAAAAPARTSLPDLEDEVMCVSCGIPLNIAESPQATDERNAIRVMIAKGYDKQQVKDELVGTYGPRVLADPGDDGFNLTTWLVPLGALLVGLGAAGALLARIRTRPPGGPSAPGGPELSAADARRLDADLARYD